MAATPSNSINATSAGLVKFDGTSAFTGVTVTQHDILVGAASNGITSVAPSATSGVPVISQGASSDPAFGTATVPGGGTGIVSATAYAPICGGTSTTGNFQSATTGLSTTGFVFTSNGSAALPSWQAASGGATLSPYIVGATGSDYTTIQAAINKAISDGASTAAQINIYIKPGTYTANITLADGINLVAFGESASGTEPLALNQSVTIVGSCTFGTGNNTLQGISIAPPSGTVPLQYTGTFTFPMTFFVGCQVSSVNADLVSADSTDTQLYITDSLFIAQSGKLYTGIAAFTVKYSRIFTDTVSTTTGDVLFTAYYSQITASITAATLSAGSGTFTYTAEHCRIASPTSVLFNVDSSYTTGASGYFDFCDLGGLQMVLSNSTADNTLQFLNCTDVNLSGITIPVTTGLHSNQVFASNCYDSSANAVVNKFGNQGYIGSQTNQIQGKTQTTDNTQTTLLSVVVNELDSIVLQGRLIGSTAAHTNSVGGTFMINAMRATSGNVTIVGAAVVSVQTTSAATFTADVDTGTQTVRLRVTGVAATVYNWVATADYHKVRSDA